MGCTVWSSVHNFHCTDASFLQVKSRILNIAHSSRSGNWFQFSLVSQLCPILCDPMDYSTPGFLTHQQLLEVSQTHVHQVGDAIQPSHLLSSPSPSPFNLSQHQGLFKWVSSSHQVAKVSEFQLQHQYCQWMFRTDLLQNGLVRSPCSPRDSQESSPTPQFKNINLKNCIQLSS